MTATAKAQPQITRAPANQAATQFRAIGPADIQAALLYAGNKAKASSGSTRKN